MEYTKEWLLREVLPQLIYGAKIKIGRTCAQETGLKAGEIIELEEVNFEFDNGLYTVWQSAPGIKREGEYDSIFHLFGNDLEWFLDCKII